MPMLMLKTQGFLFRMSIKIAFVASKRPEAQNALRSMIKRYGQCDEADADVIVALGGDGCMLDTLRRRFDDPVPVYGMNQGTVGFMMNDYREDELINASIRLSAPLSIRSA